MTDEDIIDKIKDKFDKIEDKIYNINKEFSTKEEIEKMKEEEDSSKIDDLYGAIYKESRKINESYKTVKYKLYSDSIKEVYDLIKNGFALEERKDFDLVRKSARKTALVFLNEINMVTKDPFKHEYFRKLASIIATD